MSIYNLGRILSVYRGTYNETEQYKPLDLVYTVNGTFVAKKPITGIAPSEDDVENWQIVCKNITNEEIKQIYQQDEATRNARLTAFINEASQTLEDLEASLTESVNNAIAPIATTLTNITATVEAGETERNNKVNKLVRDTNYNFSMAEEERENTLTNAINTINNNDTVFKTQLQSSVNSWLNEKGVEFSESQAQRATEFNAQEASRAGRFNTQLNNQATAFTNSETERNNTFTASEQHRAEIFNSKEEDRDKAVRNLEVATERMDELEAKLDTKADINGYYEDLTAGWALNLVSPDGITTNDSYIYRTTGGSESISTGDAKIQLIKGRTVKMNSLLNNGNFTDTTTWANYNATNNTFTVADNIATLKKNTYNQDSNLFIWNNQLSSTKQTFLQTTHKYYFKAFVKTTAPAGQLIMGQMNRSGALLGEYASNVTTPNWQLLSYVDNAKWHTLQPFWGFAYTGNSTTIEHQVKNVTIIDLTVMFGEGNEPTKEVADQIFTNEFYPKQANTNISTEIVGYKTTGFNQINEANIIKEYYLWGNSTTPQRGTYCWVTRYTNVIGGATYHFSHPFDPANYTGRTPTLYIFDSAKNLISYSDKIQMECDITLPQNARYIRVSAYVIQWTSKSWFCMNFKWSGYKDGEHLPYQETVINLPINELTDTNGNILFPNGLQSNGVVYDEINTTQAVKRIADDGTILSTPIAVNHNFSLTYNAEDFGTEEYLYKEGAINLPVTTTNYYIKNLRDKIRNIDGNTDQGAIMNPSFSNFIEALEQAFNCTVTKTWNDNKNEWQFTITVN